MAVLKRPRTESKADPTAKIIKDSVDQIRQLERQVAESKTHLNNIVTLIQFCEHESPKVVHAAMHALFRVFSPMLSKGELQKPKKAAADDKKATVTLWLRDNYVKFLNKTCDALNLPEAGLQIPALKIVLDLLKLESAAIGVHSGGHHFANDLYFRVVDALLNCSHMSQPLLNEFTQKYFGYYDDLRFYFLKNAATIINTALGSHQKKDSKMPQNKKQKLSKPAPSAKLALLLENSYAIMETLKTMPTEAKEIDEFWTGNPDPSGEKKDYIGDSLGFSDDEEDELVEDLTKDASATHVKRHPLLTLLNHKRVFSDCWIAILRLPFTPIIYKKTLLIVHKRIIPHLPQPTVLMDFLTDSYNAGGAISLLALKGLFILITEHNLDYPDFFKKLYVLFDRNLMHVKYRARFFSQVDIFLSSPLLPAQLVAAFIKRMARLGLSSPPASIVIIIPFIYNLLKRHPTCMQLIHGKADGDMNDTYDHSEEDPMKCNALNSSLWELQTLQNHFAPNVSTLAKIFNEQFTKPSYNLEDFLDHTYATMFQNEVSKKRKGEAALAVEAPKGLFVANVEATADEDDNESVVPGWESWF
ncbi:U3 small nucleolar RNA-associated protein 19 [Entomortierella parvispora]|uniref:U3 small nucleolar RNA-associated protein 19 n=1 Tax=Entomortierella parvispora TaxID=205924 RepID=A0A9P3H360_9FUNG|nr:U3 small nucleolar RNA-associated protein 19 [Entomortierella parvispora]